MHPEVFPNGPESAFAKKTNSPLLTFHPTIRFDPLRAAPSSSLIRKQTKKPKSTLLRFFAPPAFWHQAATCTGPSNSRLRSALRFSQPLSALLRLKPSRPCFIPVRSWGLSLQRLPLAGIRTPPDARSPPDVTSRLLQRFPRQAAFHVTIPARPPSGVLTLQRVRSSAARCYPHPGAVPLLGFLPPRVSQVPRWARLHAPSSHALPTPARLAPERARLPFARCPRVSFTQPVACLPPLPKEPRKTAVLPGFDSLFTLDHFEKPAPPWLIVSPPAPEHVTAS
jgi:hypothetical protein